MSEEQKINRKGHFRVKREKTINMTVDYECLLVCVGGEELKSEIRKQ